jgi:ABC-type transport system involved in multi-copper enzyme maturation permease subunit
MQLLDRAFVPPRNLLLEFFKKLDGFFEELNQQTTRGVLLVREVDTGPMFDPIAWRETRKRSLGTVRYLFRLLVVLEVPLAIAIAWTVSDFQATSFDGPTAFFLTMLWPISVLAITVHATNVIYSERSRQTLDVLLVTPLSANDLVSQKLAGVRRLIGVLSVPLLTLLIFQSIWTLYVVRGLGIFQAGAHDGYVFIHEIAGMTIALIVYPRVVQWLAFGFALRVKNQTQAVLFSLAASIGICGIPFALVYLVAIVFSVDFSSTELEWISWLSPVRVLFHRRFVDASQITLLRSVREDYHFIGLILHTVVFVGLWLTLRYQALREFSHRMGRTERARGEA